MNKNDFTVLLGKHHLIMYNVPYSDYPFGIFKLFLYPIIIDVMSYKGQKDYKSCKVQSHTTTPLFFFVFFLNISILQVSNNIKLNNQALSIHLKTKNRNVPVRLCLLHAKFLCPYYNKKNAIISLLLLL